MSFQLNVTFAGLCLLVNESGKALKVLMPLTGSNAPTPHGKHATEHEAVLIYPTSQAKPGGTDATQRTEREIAGRSIDLSGVKSSTPLDLTLPEDVVALQTATSKPVNESLLDGDGAGHLASRIILTSGRVDWHHPGAKWSLKGRPSRHMAIAVKWVLEDVPGSSLDLRLKALGGETHEDLKLYPRADGELDLYFFHAPADEIPTSLPPAYMAGYHPVPNEQAHHFAGLYQLLDQPVVPAPIPVWLPHPGAEASHEDVAEKKLGTMHTCIVGSATV